VGTAALAPRTHQHAVAFHEHDDELVRVLARFTIDGLAQDERVIVVATGPHRAALDIALLDEGIEPNQERATGRLTTLDAHATLDAFRLEGSLARDRFAATARAIVRDALAEGSRVRVFGEMVALLWEQGDVAGALELEAFWAELLDEVDIEVLCGYPTSALGDARLGDVSEVCALHSTVHPPLGYATGAPAAGATIAEYSQVFLPVPEAVAAVRRFVTEVLTHWREHDLVTDATLVASELATNAVLHASSPFRASVDRSVGAVCIAIQDVTSEPAAPQDATSQDGSGRGMVIVEALSRRWGSDALLTGKVVWAELATTSTDL
jgi:anti-sigma regulatory factor (Ser/Thr protein kinase)